MLNKIKTYFTSSFTLLIYMRSGNVVKVSGVTDWELKAQGNTVTGITLKQKFKGHKLIVNSIDLSQIEAVVRVY